MGDVEGEWTTTQRLARGSASYCISRRMKQSVRRTNSGRNDLRRIQERQQRFMSGRFRWSSGVSYRWRQVRTARYHFVWSRLCTSREVWSVHRNLQVQHMDREEDRAE